MRASWFATQRHSLPLNDVSTETDRRYGILVSRHPRCRVMETVTPGGSCATECLGESVERPTGCWFHFRLVYRCIMGEGGES